MCDLKLYHPCLRSCLFVWNSYSAWDSNYRIAKITINMFDDFWIQHKSQFIIYSKNYNTS